MEDRAMTSSSNRSGSLMNLGGEVADLTGEVHHLPCCIKFSGPSSDISHYFKPKPTGIVNEGGLAVEKAYFRGRELLGATTPIPHGYSGFVVALEKDAKDDSCKWKARAKFTTAAFWNHDSLPSQNDTSLRSLHWLTVSNALHKPVTAEELAAAPV